MLSNYFKTAYRNILRNEGYAIINSSGLALGLAIFSMAVIAFPLTIVLNELMRPLFDALVGNPMIG